MHCYCRCLAAAAANLLITPTDAIMLSCSCLFVMVQLAAKRGQLGESSFQRLNLALLFASAFNLIFFLQNAATGGIATDSRAIAVPSCLSMYLPCICSFFFDQTPSLKHCMGVLPGSY